MVDIFRDSTKSVPTRDSMIVRVSMEENEIAGRKDNLPSQSPTSPPMSISHVPNANKG